LRNRINKETKEKVAIKMIDLEASSEEFEDIQMEIQFLAELQTPYCVRYYGSFVKEHQLMIVMEYVGGGSISEQVRSLIQLTIAFSFPLSNRVSRLSNSWLLELSVKHILRLLCEKFYWV
jgi:serine/threonine protein kinase